MKKYIIKRTFISLLILLFLSALIYFLIRLMPGDYVKNTIVGNTKITYEMKNSLIASYGLNEGIVSGYFKWIASALSGSFGTSFIYKIPVSEVIGKTIWVTLFISVVSFVLEIVISIFLGIASAVNKNKITDNIISALSIVGISMPGFFFAVILQKIFAIQLPLFPVSGLVSVREDYTGIYLAFDMLWHLFLPVLVIVLTGIGSYTKFIRTNTLEILNSDFVLTARAKGLSGRAVITRHVFPNTLVPLISIISTQIPTLFTRTLIVEQIFSIHGFGYAAFAAMKMSDTPLIMGFTIFLALITIISILISDILYAVADPRIRLGKG